MTEPIHFSGRVTRLGYYRDTLPLLVITIKKGAAHQLPDCTGERFPLLLTFHGETFQAGIRTTPKAQSITLCPDLLDAAGKQTRLTDLLLRQNIQQKATLILGWDAGQRRLTLGASEFSG